MCDFVASSQAFVAKAEIACDHWCPYILRHRAPLCILLTHVWKPGFTLINITYSHCICTPAGENTSVMVLCSLLPIMGGLALTSAYEISFNFTGLLAALGTNITEW